MSATLQTVKRSKSDMKFRVGIDLGGTKIEILALSMDGEELYRKRVSTPQNDYHQLIRTLADLVSEIEVTIGSDFTLGIGTPGSVSQQTGAMKNCNSVCINGQFLHRDIESQIERKVCLANDANCFALSEAVDGAGYLLPVVFGVILGTGVGGGLVVNGKPLIGPNTIGSEWGHNILPGVGTVFEDESRECYCGRTNCIETYLSGSGLSKTYNKFSQKLLLAHKVSVEATRGETEAIQAIDLYQRQLAFSLSQLINIVDPDVIVLGGGLSNISSLYDLVPKLWVPAIFTDNVNTKLLPARFGDSSGVRGAAWLPTAEK